MNQSSEPPLVSVIVPCYNQEEYLSEALDSVLSQSLSKWECIIVNDGSPDNTEEVAKRYCSKDTRIKYSKKENGGVSSARNAGINMASGEYILPLDADDLIDKTYLEKAVKVFREQKNVGVVYCHGRFFGERNDDMNVAYPTYTGLLLGNQVFCSALYKRSDFLNTEGYNTDMTEGLEDWEFWIRFLKNKRIFQIPETLFFYRIKSVSRNQEVVTNDKINEALEIKIYKNNLDIYLEEFGSPIKLMRDYEILKAQKRIEKSKIVDEVQSVFYNSISYRIGNTILKPLRVMRSLVGKIIPKQN